MNCYRGKRNVKWLDKYENLKQNNTSDMSEYMSDFIAL